MRLLLFAAIFFAVALAQASPSLDLGAFYSSDNFVTSSTTASTSTYLAVDILTNFDNRKQFYGGFHVAQTSITQTTTVSTTFTSLDMGPFLTYVIDQKGTYSVTLGYNVRASGAYNDGTNSATWTGTNMQAAFAVTPEIKDNFYVGFKLNYIGASYTKEVIGSVAADVSYTRTRIFPTFNMMWRN